MPLVNAEPPEQRTSSSALAPFPWGKNFLTGLAASTAVLAIPAVLKLVFDVPVPAAVPLALGYLCLLGLVGCLLYTERLRRQALDYAASLQSDAADAEALRKENERLRNAVAALQQQLNSDSRRSPLGRLLGRG